MTRLSLGPKVLFVLQSMYLPDCKKKLFLHHILNVEQLTVMLTLFSCETESCSGNTLKDKAQWEHSDE